MKILPKAFWDAVVDGIYPPCHEGILAFNIKEYAALIKGFSYANTIYNNEGEFYVNVLAIKDVAFLSFHSHSKPERVDATIEYNPTRKRAGKIVCDMTYFSYRMEKDPILYQFLQKIKMEFFTTLEEKLLERPRRTGTIPFLKTIRIIACCATWKKLMDLEPNLPPEEKADKIASITLLELEPGSVAEHVRFSSDHEVHVEAIRASFILQERVHGITGKWRTLIDEEPDLTPGERVEKLSAKSSLSLFSITSYARFSPDSRVRKEAHDAYKYLLVKTLDITSMWKDLIKSKPTMTPMERAEKIASEKKLDPITVAMYGCSSRDRIVKSEAYKAKSEITELKREITEIWLELIVHEPCLTPKQRAEKIAAKKQIKPSIIAFYSRASDNPLVKRDAHKAFRYNITIRWLKLRKERPKLTPAEIATQIAEQLSLSPITITKYGRESLDPMVKRDAIAAHKILYEKKLNITNRWLRLKNERLELTPAEISTQIAEELSLSPITIASFGKFSSVEIVKSEAYKAFYALSKKPNKSTEIPYL